MIGIALCICLVNPGPGDSGSIPFPDNLYLVRTKTLGFRDWSARLKITEVMAGPGELLSKEFELSLKFRARGSGDMPDFYIDNPREGSDGLFWVKRDDIGNVVAVRDLQTINGSNLQSFPYQFYRTKPHFLDPMRSDLSQDDLWKEGLAFAKAVGEVYVAKNDEERRRLLERIAGTEGTPAAGWAIALIAKGPPQPAVKFLRGLVDKDKLDASSQSMLDYKLCELAPEWVHTEERQQMIARWLSPKADNYTFTHGCRQIIEALHDGDMDGRMYAELVGSAILESGPSRHRHDIGNVTRAPSFKRYYDHQFVSPVRELYEADGTKERLALLERYAATENTPAAGWAMTLLARDPNPATICLLRGLVKHERLEATSQVRLDELLCRLDAKAWIGSMERKEYLSRWVDPVADKSLFCEGCLRLRDARAPDLDVKMFAEVVMAAVAQADKMTNAQVLALGDVVRSSPGWFGADKTAARAFLEGVKKAATSDDVRRDAEDGLLQLDKR